MVSTQKEFNCKVCNNQRYLIKPAGRFCQAVSCHVCASTCKKCDNTGYLFELDEFKRDVAIPCECQTIKKNISIFNNACIPDIFHDATLDNFDLSSRSTKLKKALQSAQKAVDQYPQIKGKGLLFYGSVGTGKTRLVSAMLREFVFKYSIPCLFVEFTRLLSDIRAGYDAGMSERALIEPIHQIDILVIDELGKGRKSEWELNILDIIISDRYNSGKTTIFTTNYTEKKESTYQEKFRSRTGDQKEVKLSETLKERVHGRIYSRLKEMCDFVDLNLQQDYRSSDHSEGFLISN